MVSDDVSKVTRSLYITILVAVTMAMCSIYDEKIQL